MTSATFASKSFTTMRFNGNTPCRMSFLSTTNNLSVKSGKLPKRRKYRNATSMEISSRMVTMSKSISAPTAFSGYESVDCKRSRFCVSKLSNKSCSTSFGKSGAKSASSSVSSCSAAANNSFESMSAIKLCRTESFTSSRISPSLSALTNSQRFKRSSSGKASRMCATSAGCSSSNFFCSSARFCLCTSCSTKSCLPKSCMGMSCL